MNALHESARSAPRSRRRELAELALRAALPAAMALAAILTLTLSNDRTGAAETLSYTFPSSGVYYLVLDNYGTGAGGAFTLTGSITCNVVPANKKTWGAVKSYYR